MLFGKKYDNIVSINLKVGINMDSDNNLGQDLKRKRDECGMSLQEASDLSGVSISHISRLENGKRIPGYLIYEKLKKIYSKNEPTDIVRDASFCVPVLGSVRAGAPSYAYEDIEEYFEISEMYRNKIDFALRISGDSMNELNIKNNDIVFIKKQAQVENGEIAVVLIDDEDATIKKFYRTDNTVTLIPKSTNPQYLPLIYDLKKTNVSVVGKVVSAYIVL